ncbi:hypothetical protein [Nonomuraea sp. NPDC049141]|uniref:hypothetical protein n=1 Tax=Nonomuraea sp. NPDC049141 TaxID=3155500 RepID=UPI0033CEADD1
MPIDHTPPLRVAADSRLSADVLLIEQVSVAPEAPNHMSVAIDADGNTLLLAITPGAGAVELRDPADSSPGRTLRPLPRGADASEIVSLVDGDGLVHAFYATDTALLHAVRRGGKWSASQDLPPCAGLSVSEIPLTGAFAVTGVTAKGDLVLCTADGGKWGAVEVNLGGRLLGGEARLAYTSPDAWVLFGAAGGELRIWPGVEGRVAADPAVVKVKAPVARLLATYAHADSAMAVFTDTAHNLYTSAGFSDTPTQIPLGVVVQGSAEVGDDGLLRCYGCDPNGRLWLLRQTSWAGDGSPKWAPIFPLDTDAVQVRTPAAGSGVVAVTRVDGGLDLLSRDGPAGRWTRVPVHAASAAAPTRVSRYRTRLTVTDANGLPCQGVRVELTPSRLVGLEIAGRGAVARPALPAVLTTDETGAVEFTQPATGLDPVTFTARADGAPAALAITPHGYLLDALAGRAPVFTGRATIPPMSAQTLLGARAGGKPLLPDSTPELADAAAGAIMEIARACTDAKPAEGGFELDLRDQASPRFVRYDTSEAVAARMADFHREAAAVELAVGDSDLAGELFAESLGSWFADLWHAISTGAAKLVNFIVDPNTQTASALLEYAEGVWSLAKGLVVEGAAEFGSFLRGVLDAIGAAWHRFKDWVQDELHWDSVWRTMDAFHGYVTGGLSQVSTWLEDSAAVAAGRFFADLKSEVDAGLDRAVAALGDRTIAEIAAGRGLTAIKPPVGAMSAVPGSTAQNEYVLSKVMTSLAGHPLPKVPGLSDSLGERLIKAVEDSGFLRDGDRAVRDLTALCEPWFRDPAALGRTRAADLLTVLRDLIDLALDCVDVAAVALLDLAAEVVRGLSAALGAPMTDDPLLTWFWENVVRPDGRTDKMTLGRLICLAYAAPVTLACLLRTGRGPYDPRVTASAQGASATDRGLADAQVAMSCVLMGVDAVTDLVNYANMQVAVSDKAAVCWNAFDFVANAVVQRLFAPTADEWRSTTRGAQLSNETYGCFWVPILTDAAFTLVDFGGLFKKISDRDSSQLFRANTVMDCLMGLALIGSGVAGASYQLEDHDPDTTPVDIFEAVMAPLPWVGQPLLIPEVVDSSEGGSLAVQLVLDVLGDFDYDVLEKS